MNFEVERVQKKLNNPGFVNKAPQAVVDEEKSKEQDYIERLHKVEVRIKELNS